MRSSLSFVVNHAPVGQPRHKVTIFNGHPRMYLPVQHPVHAFKKAIKAEWKGSPFFKAFEGPVEIDIQCWFPRPKSKQWKRKTNTAYRHTTKPDIDNVTKAVLDALNKLAWHDDAQVCGITVRKFVCGECSPRVEIWIGEVSNGE